jgi:epoxyqueuosine reductase QueG
MSLKERIKQQAYELGADLVGFGGIERCRQAPVMMSPQGVFPGARTVIVMAVHHPDACIELGGEQHPQEIGPYSVQYLMNSRLDEMVYRLASFVERQGYGAIPIASSNIWRYNQYKDLKAVFAPDLSHIYMAVVAGLADIGFNGLAMTPEYGARNRFITLLTDAEIPEDPLLPPGTVCDRCMLCRKHCPTQALAKEIDGDKVLRIADYEYRFPNKNLWRCAWGEHFDLDLDLEIPEVVTEQVILENVKAHGMRSGEMGQCLKYCLPKALRSFDRSYSTTPLRRYGVTRDEALISRGEIDRLLAGLFPRGADAVIVSSAAEVRLAGLDLEAILPGARSAVTVAVTCPPEIDRNEFRFGAQYQVDSLCYDLTRAFEDFGCRSLMTVQRSGSHPDPTRDVNPTAAILSGLAEFRGRTVLANTVVTRLALAPQQRLDPGVRARLDVGDATAELTGHLAALARSLGADLVGVASGTRIDELATQLRPAFEADDVLDASDTSTRFTPWEPVIKTRKRQVKTATDWLPGASSILVFGLRYHKEVLRWATRPPAEAVGPYSFQTYVTNWLGTIIGYRLVQALRDLGYQAVITTDLTATDSLTANPRGPQPDLFANRFAGLAAGLGWIAASGHLTTPQFGIRQRCIAIVTNAPLRPSSLCVPTAAQDRCAACPTQPCVATCPSQALGTRLLPLTCDGQTFSFPRIDPKRCDWCKRYALDGDCGFRYLGSPVDLPAPADITAEALAAGLRQHDPIKKYRPVVAEPCVINCPLAVTGPESR